MKNRKEGKVSAALPYIYVRYLILPFRKFRGGLKEVSEAASPVWKELSSEEKEPYKRQAERAKKVQKSTSSFVRSDRLTSFGVPVQEIESMAKEESERVKQQKRRVKRIIDHGTDNNCKHSELISKKKFD